MIPRVVIVYLGTRRMLGRPPLRRPRLLPVGDPGADGPLVAFAAKLAAAWDDDPRVAASSRWACTGKWGENNIYPDEIGGSDRIPVEVQKPTGDAFVAAFKNKKVMVRYPDTFAGYQTFGFYWDSFALPDDDNAGGGAGIVTRDLWRTQMVSGEVAYDWGDQSKLGGSPNGTLASAANTDYVIGAITRLHASSLGWIAEYTADGATISANAARLQKSLGYRYVIDKATFGAAIAAGGRLDVALTVAANVGSAPFYYRWPVEVSLLDGARKVAWRGTVDGADVTQWQPGGTVELKATFTPSVAAGTYTLAVAILDPAANAPALRFANSNYYRGGRTPLGRVAVGLSAAPAQDLGAFDALKPTTKSPAGQARSRPPRNATRSLVLGAVKPSWRSARRRSRRRSVRSRADPLWKKGGRASRPRSGGSTPKVLPMSTNFPRPSARPGSVTLTVQRAVLRERVGRRRTAVEAADPGRAAP